MRSHLMQRRLNTYLYPYQFTLACAGSLVELMELPKPLTVPPPAQNTPGTAVPPHSERRERHFLYHFRSLLSHACFVLVGVSLPGLFLVGPEIGTEWLATGSLLLLLAGQAKTNVPLSNPTAPSSVWETGRKCEDQCWWRREQATSGTGLLCFLWLRSRWRGGLVAGGH